jgi:YD repeat-containing protein
MRTASYDWDAAGRLLGFVDGAGTARAFSYDLLGRLRRAEAPDFGWREYGWDGGRRVSLADI